MKHKLIAMLITTTLLGGVGATAYASANSDDNNVSNCKTSIECNKDSRQAQKGDTSCSKVKSAGEVKNDCFSYLQGISKNLSKFIYGKIDCNSSNCYGEEENLVQDNGQNQDNKKIEEKKENSNNKKVEKVSKTNKVNKTTKKATDKKNTSKVAETSKSNADTKTSVANNDKFMEQVQAMIFKKVNEERKRAGVSELSYSSTMEKYAKIKSQDMGDRKYFDHKDPEGNLITAKMKKDGVNYRAWGENIAYIGGGSDANELANQFMRNWMNSPGHRANILSNNFSSIGVGVYKTGNTVYATQEFYK